MPCWDMEQKGFCPRVQKFGGCKYCSSTVGFRVQEVLQGKEVCAESLGVFAGSGADDGEGGGKGWGGGGDLAGTVYLARC